jgi:hypothetical protein
MKMRAAADSLLDHQLTHGITNNFDESLPSKQINDEQMQDLHAL